MPPRFAPSVTGMAASVYSQFAERLAKFPGETWPLHVGDTWMEPAVGTRMEDLTVAAHPGMHRYTPVQGLPALVAAIVARLQARTGCPTEPANVLVAAGGTGGLAAVIGAIVAPGDEVLVLAPYWPLIGGVTTTFHGRSVPVSILEGGGVLGADAVVAACEARRTARTVAVYLNTPNNPCGAVLSRSTVEALVAWARRHDLWILSDEVYEDYVYAGEHTYTRPLAPERTFAVYSFSKAYGMAGNRVGYIVGPADAMVQVRKVSTHTFYSAPTGGQLAALAALRGAGDAWVAQVKPAYQRVGDEAARRLGVPAPAGGTFLFVDVARALDASGLPGFLERCVQAGLLVAPGPSFGPFPTHVRLCFTCAPPDAVLRGVDALVRVIGGDA
jgi:aspartate/methionine/tyrosine aminotransferase